MAAFHASMAAAHRSTEQRHLVAARIHAAYAQRLEAWVRIGARRTSRPVLMMAVAAAAGLQSATLTVLAEGNTEALVAASDPTSRAAHELEVAFAEGPAGDAMNVSAPVVASGSEVPDRWPQYGPALQGLGVRSVAAVGLRVDRNCLGSLTVFDRNLLAAQTVAQKLGAIGNAVVHGMLLDPDPGGTEADVPALTLFEQDDFQAVLHQAAGKIHARSGCGINSALVLIRARAFAEGKPVAAVAQDVMRGVVTLP
jgi:hypothetical protein